MSAARNEPPAGRAADLPLSARRELEVDKQRELGEGLTRRHVQNANEQRHVLAAHFFRLLRAGPALAAKLRGE